MSVLEPNLTELDLSVLAAVPSPRHEDGSYDPGVGATIWQIGEAVGITDLDGDLAPLLRGLRHLGYIQRSIPPHPRHVVWWRERRGDEAVRDTGRGS